MATIDLEQINKLYPNGFHAVKDLNLKCATASSWAQNFQDLFEYEPHQGLLVHHGTHKHHREHDGYRNGNKDAITNPATGAFHR
jgi:hypothetical protein